MKLIAKAGRKGQKRSFTQLEWELLAEAARLSPSASNQQPWQFILIDDRAVLNDLELLLDERQSFNAAIACLALASETFITKGLERPFWMIDLPIAISSITLMAGALKISSQVYLEIEEGKINSLLGLDTKYRTVGIVGLR